MEIINQISNNSIFFLLILARIVGVFLSAPVFSHNNIPIYIKLGLCLFLAFIIFPFVKIPINFIEDNIYYFLLINIKELITGILLGFICYLFFSSIYLAGHMVDMDLGFSIANVIDPHNDTEIPLSANLFYMIAVLVFLAINGHHKLLYALKYSFDVIPLGAWHMNHLMLDQLIQILTDVFMIAFKMSAPVVVTIFLSNIFLGILARTMPQMNVFVVGMPLKMLIGFTVLFLIIPLYTGFYEYIFDTMFKNLQYFIKIITEG